VRCKVADIRLYYK